MTPLHLLSSFLLSALLAPAPPAAILIEGVPHIRQKPDSCGEACVAMMLRKLGHDAGQDLVFNQSGLDPIEGRGCYTRELADAMRKLGFRVGDVWRPVPAARGPEGVDEEWGALVADLRKGIASIVCMRYSGDPDAPEHFRLVLGHDADADEVIYHEPAEDDGAYRRMKRAEFLGLWPLKHGEEKWTVIRLRLEPGRMRIERSRDRFTPADYAQHVLSLRKRTRLDGFTLVLAPPFVVLGDESPEIVRRRASDTVEWAARKLKAEYFKKDPDEILDVWLFRDRESYEGHVKEIFGRPPTTPFGYYSAEDRALVMNIATGGGTLVHEIVHPFMGANFPACPAWFNEGLASLYEQCGEHDGRIRGFTNWRLEGLKEALRAGKVPSFKDLTGTSDGSFYRSDRGTNYAQARYLCYYLQEKGLLGTFYREFSGGAAGDPTGYASLRKVLRRSDERMEAFGKEWEEFVLGLTFP